MIDISYHAISKVIEVHEIGLGKWFEVVHTIDGGIGTAHVGFRALGEVGLSIFFPIVLNRLTKIIYNIVIFPSCHNFAKASFNFKLFSRSH